MNVRSNLTLGFAWNDRNESSNMFTFSGVEPLKDRSLIVRVLPLGIEPNAEATEKVPKSIPVDDTVPTFEMVSTSARTGVTENAISKAHENSRVLSCKIKHSFFRITVSL